MFSPGQLKRFIHDSRLNQSFSIESEDISTQHLETRQMKEWIIPAAMLKGAELGNPSLTITPHLISKLKIGIFMLPNTMDGSKTSSPLEVVDSFQTMLALKLPHYMMSVSIGTSSRSMQAKTVTLDNSLGYQIIFVQRYI